MKIAVAGTGYVGLSVALLLSQHNEVHALDIVPEKVEMLNSGVSPIVDSEITNFLTRNTSGERPLDFHATSSPKEAYSNADLAIIATPTNYDAQMNYFDTSSVESAISTVREYAPKVWIVIKSTIPVGYTRQLRNRLHDDHILFSPSFCVKAMHCTITCIRAALWSALRRMINVPFGRHAISQHRWRKVRIQWNGTVRIRTAAPVFRN